MLTTTSAKITGIPDSSGWSQVHEFKPEDSEKIEKRGTLYAVIATKRVEDSGIDIIATGRELISRLHEEYYGDLTAKPFNALKISLEKVTSEFEKTWGDVEIVACSLVGDVVYSAAVGAGGVTIEREGALGLIIKSSGKEVAVASGYPKNNDVMLLATKSFYERLSQGVIKAALTSETPEGAVEVFGPGVHEGAGSGGVAAVVIKFSQESIEGNVPTTPVSEEVSKKVNVLGNNIYTLGEKTKKIFEKILHIFPEKGIYVHPQTEEDVVVSHSKKLTFSVALSLLLVLAISIGFGIRQKKINDLKGKYEAILQEAQKDVDDAIGFASVSPDKSRELFRDSEQKLAEINALNVKDPAVDALRKKIEDSRGAILGEYDVTPQPFLDLSLLSSGFRGDSISLSADQVFILDKSGMKVVSIVISSKKSKVVAGPTVLDQTLDLASYEDRAFVLAGDGVYEIANGVKNKVVDKSWQGDAMIRAFAGNLYILDKSGNTILRYAGSGNTFGDKQSWLAANTNVDFSGVKQWVIDGSVYVLYPNSKILKFSLGSPQVFKIGGVVPEVGNVDAIFAGEDSQNIYLLDRAGKRVVVTDKKGNYIAQYLSDSIQNATNLVASESDNKIILLTADKLFSIDIKPK